jgi:hypothetical protein
MIALRKEPPMKRWINRLDKLSLVSGLVVGLVVGMILVSATGMEIPGTASDSDNESGSDIKDYSYYLVALPTAQDWLYEKYPEKTEEIKQAVDVITRLPTAPDFRAEFKAAQGDVALVLPQVYAALGDLKEIKEIEKYDPASDILACLGMDDDPYGLQSEMYLYVTIPKAKAKNLAIPESWQKLEKPKTNALYWQLLACYPDLAS